MFATLSEKQVGMLCLVKKVNTRRTTQTKRQKKARNLIKK